MITKTLRLGLILTLITGVLGAETLPVRDFVRHGDYLDVTISPDGRHLAARVRQDGLVALAFIRREDQAFVGGVRGDESDWIHTVTWVDDERVVYELAEKIPGLDRPIPTGELFAINVDGGRREHLYGYRATDRQTGSRLAQRENTMATHKILSTLEDDDKYILIIEYPWQRIGNNYYDNRVRPPVVSRLNVYTGNKKKVEVIPYGGARALAGPDGEINFTQWRDEDDEWHAAHRGDSEQPWQELQDVFGDVGDLSPVLIDRAVTAAYLTGPSGDRGTESMFRLDLASGQFTELFPGLGTDLAGWLTDAETLEPVVGLSFPDRCAYHYVDASSPTARLHRGLAKAFEGKDLHVTSRTRDGKLIIFSVRSDVNPGHFYLFDTQTNKATLLLARRSWIDPDDMSPTQAIELSARDGQRLHGYLTLPATPGPDDGKPPLVVMPHGGPHGVRDHWGYHNEVQLLANRGYAVLRVNFRGSGGYGTDFEDAGHREWGGLMIDDVVDATRWTVDEGHADGDRICIFGASYGGYAAMMAAARAPELFRCAIGYAGVYDLNYLYTAGDVRYFKGGEAYLERIVGRDPQQLREFSPITHVNEIDAEVMLIHGGSDVRAPLKHATAMRKALEGAGKNVTWLHYGGAGHGVWDIENAEEVYTGVLDFLATNLEPR